MIMYAKQWNLLFAIILEQYLTINVHHNSFIINSLQ